MVGVQSALRLTMIMSSDPNIRTFLTTSSRARASVFGCSDRWAGNEQTSHQTETADTHGARAWHAWTDGERQERFRTRPAARRPGVPCSARGPATQPILPP